MKKYYMKLKKIYDYIDKLAPFENQDKIDNSGLIIGTMNAEIKTVCVSLDATLDVIKEAAEKNADLLITHHPVIFKPIYSVETKTPVYELIKNNMNIISAHTSFDAAQMSDIMLEKLGFPKSGDVLNEKDGYGKTVKLNKPLRAEELCFLVKEAFKCTVVRYTDGGKQVKKVAVCSGSGGDELENAVKHGCDALITGDVKWSVFVAAKNIGFTLIDAGHFHTENIMCGFLCDNLKEKFSELNVFIAENSADVCEYLF